MLTINANSTIIVLDVATKNLFTLSEIYPDNIPLINSNNPNTINTYADFFAVSS